MNELLVRLNIFEANNLPRSEFIVTLLREINEIAFPLSLSFDFVFSSEIFKSLSFHLDRLCRLGILCLDQHAHTLHHLESLLTISFDRLDIFEGRSCISEFVQNLEHEMCNDLTSAGNKASPSHLYVHLEIKKHLAISVVDFHLHWSLGLRISISAFWFSLIGRPGADLPLFHYQLSPVCRKSIDVMWYLRDKRDKFLLSETRMDGKGCALHSLGS
ncbi:hypothetical protein Tco_0593830 [Tanacetum coccineum]